MAHKIDYEFASLQDVEAALGRQLEQLRLGKNISQATLAQEAGVSRRTITRLENGEGVSLDTFIRVLRALGVADRLAMLLPDPAVRPIDRVRLKGRDRKRAREKPPSGTDRWTWKEESDQQ